MQAAVLCSLRAREVYLYLASENRQVPQGACGIAFLGDAASGVYNVLLYKSQAQHLAKADFSGETSLTNIVNGLYVTFVDSQRQTWTILFSTEAEVRRTRARRRWLGVSQCGRP